MWEDGGRKSGVERQGGRMGGREDCGRIKEGVIVVAKGEMKG